MSINPLIRQAMGARGLGDMIETLEEPAVRKGAKLPGSHTVPDGCQWARHCEECAWPDCRLGSNDRRYAYDSEKAKEMRAKSSKTGMTKDNTAIRQPTRTHVLFSSPSIVNSSTMQKHRRMAEMRSSGISEKAVAIMFGVHWRTVRRAVEKLNGPHDKPWGRHR